MGVVMGMFLTRTGTGPTGLMGLSNIIGKTSNEPSVYIFIKERSLFTGFPPGLMGYS